MMPDRRSLALVLFGVALEPSLLAQESLCEKLRNENEVKPLKTNKSAKSVIQRLL
jgi:hypothetical protein